MIYCEVLLSTSTRGRELKIKTCHRLSGINTVDLHERSWVEKLNAIRTLYAFCGRPPREVVSWKTSFFFTSSFPSIVDLHERSWVEKDIQSYVQYQVVVDLHERSWVENDTTAPHTMLFRVDLHERSWVEKFLHSSSYLHFVSTSTRGRELKNEKYYDTGRSILSTSTRGRELKIAILSSLCSVFCCRPPREVVSWKNLSR